MAYKFLGNVIISGYIKCETALHIGGTVEGYEIGGMDNPVLKDPVSGYPYIPGSSLKGKMRSLLEWSKGLVMEVQKGEKEIGEVHACNEPKCIVCRIFGTPAEGERKIGPTRVLVRDAHPTEETKKILDQLQAEKGLPKAEWKPENVLNRITAKATPRTIERVPKGSKFGFEMVYGLYQVKDENENNITDINYLQYLFEAMRLLQDSALGGYGSRGSGKITFEISNLKLKTVKDYEQGTNGSDLPIIPLGEIKFENLAKEITAKLSKDTKSEKPNTIS